MNERRRIEAATSPRPAWRSAERPPRLRVGVLVDLHWSPTRGRPRQDLGAAGGRCGRGPGPGQPTPDRSDRPLPRRPEGDAPARPARALPDPPAAVQQRPPAVPVAHPRSHRSGAPQPAAHVAAARLRRHSHDRRHVRGGAHRRARLALARHTADQLGPHHDAVLHARVHRRHRRGGWRGAGCRGCCSTAASVARAAEARMQRLLDAHHRRCAFVLASRTDDRARLAGLLGPERVGLLRRGIERELFDPERRDRRLAGGHVRDPRGAPGGDLVGRLDPIKNVLVLAQAVRALIDRGRGPSPAVRGQGARSRRRDSAARRPRELPGRARSGHAGPRLRVGRSVRAARGDRGAVQRRARSHQLGPAAGGGERAAAASGSWSRARRASSRARRRRRRGRTALAGAAARPGAPGRDGTGGPRMVAGPRPDLAPGAGRRSAARLAARRDGHQHRQAEGAP